MSFVILNEKFIIIGASPETFSLRNPDNKEGNIKKGMRFKDKGINTPIILTKLFFISNNIFFSRKL